MFIEACVASCGIHFGSVLYHKIRNKLNEIKNKPKTLRTEENRYRSGNKFSVRKIEPSCKKIYTSGKDKIEKSIHWDLTVTTVALGLAAVSTLLYPVLSVPTLLLLIYSGISIFRKVYEAIFKEGRVNIFVLDFVLLSGLIATGHFFIAALGRWSVALSTKLLFKTKDNSEKRLFNLFGELPNTVWILKEGTEIEVPFEELRNGDTIVVNAGEIIPADGIIINGIALIDQQILTGESQPFEAGKGEEVFASTLLLSGRISIRADKSGKETVAARIGEVLRQTADFKLSVQSRGEIMADKTVLPTLGIGGLAFAALGSVSALSVLYSAIGYDIRLIMPLSVLNFLRIASENGMLIKDGRAMESLSRVDTVVFDKTGTLTQEQPRIGNIHTINGYEEDELLKYAAAAEHKQTHPIARAIIYEAKERKLDLPDIADASCEVGNGIRVSLSGKMIRVGSVRFMDAEGIAIPRKIRNIMSYCHEQGYSLVMVSVNDHLVGAIELHSAVRPEAADIIRGLKKRNLSLYIISGDHENPTKQLAQELGIENYFAETLPENKADLIEKLREEGRTTCFIGDGINDSIALKKSDVSVSLRGASTIATDTAQIILMDKSLSQLCRLFDLARKLDANLNTGFLTTVIPGTIIISGVFLLHFGLITSTILSNFGLVAGVTNSMLPLIIHRNND
ncbi:MAG: heavy metal translocating P-type ATPase [Candidatus Magnetoglobus multicellularis str. Araruama]|uniref:Heavy metal translocating P-type ATPase n=1 Tax=Candidatus Magnetoglobus multicellularis str. Araruama TaxID=890399 RepID=A0A1V1P0W4_9BACT|nr:MAG: heavy metal translocating P-type ATPase [Candidatus Magnetoglobus multicellularis str. Araruama]